MNLRQKAVKGFVWSAIQSWGSQAIGFLVFATLSRLLETKVFGLVAMASVFLAFIQVFIDQGFSTAIVQRQELTQEHLDTAFWTNIGIGSAMTVIGIVAAPTVADFFKQEALAPIVAWLSASFVLSALSSVQEAILKRDLNFRPLAVRTLIATVVGGCVGVAMAYRGFGVWSLVGQQLSNNLVQVIVLWLASKWRPGWKISRSHFKELFVFGINIVGINILNFVNRRSDDLLIGYFLGPIALGYYAIAYRLLLIMTQLLTSISSQVAMPTFSQLQQQIDKLRKAFYTVTELTSFIAFPAFVGVAVLAPQLVPFFFGAKWLPSVPVMQVLSFIGILHAIAFFYGTVVTAMGKPSWLLTMNCLNALFNFIGFAIAVRWGIVAVAAAYVIRGFLFMPVGYFLVYKLIKVNLWAYLQTFLAPCIASCVMALVLWQSVNLFGNLTSIPILLAINLLLGIVVYTLVIFAIAPKFFKQLLDLGRLAFGMRSPKSK